MVKSYKLPEPNLFIGGKFVPPLSNEYFDTENPSRGTTLGSVALAGKQDVDAAVAAARETFENPKWRNMLPIKREALLRNFASLIRQNAEELAWLDAIDAGKPISDNLRIDIPYSSSIVDYYAGWPTKLASVGNRISFNALNFSNREPYGVVALITPWNFPVINVIQKLAPALACGNTVVIKPAEEATLSALKLCELVVEAGFPEGCVNLVSGTGEHTGALLAAHEGIDKLAFTGSTETGSIIMRAAAANLTPLTLELGGKSPNIVFADADMKRAVRGAVAGIFYNSGQVCTAGSRILVQQSVFDEFMDAFIERSKRMIPGDPLKDDTRMGPVVSSAQLERVLKYIEIGKQEAELVLGGNRVRVDGLEDGFFVEPTIFAPVDNSCRIAQEEIFGPVAVVIPFADEEEAISIANSTRYGLAAGIWTADYNRALRMSERISAGTVWINGYNLYDPASPFGGTKHSGFGRELGLGSIEAFTKVKTTWLVRS